ncbi:FAD-binding oxidoreductase [Massilia sp. W12]|uniref:FAD-binding oxidoreductase n=1 Tax=Massilia sp. W12 TaxID=3126507 RepID=UPI0030CFAAFA
MSAAFLRQAQALLGPYCLTDSAAQAPYLQEWRQRRQGRALAVCLPADSAQCAALVRLCAQYRIPIVPQGGNTGLVFGGIPDASASAIVISTKRMQALRALDAQNNTICVEAGMTLQAVQQAAQQAGRLFPLSLASEGSCSIGGNLATNAGGTAVLRYGNARELCLGLEVVLADGQIWHGLHGLRKDNTGYDLRNLMIGSEGTLGIITAAVLKLFPRPKAELCCLAALPSAQAALDLLQQAQALCGPHLSGFELISGYCMRLVAQYMPELPAPLPSFEAAYYVLMEISSHQDEGHALDLLQALYQAADLQQAVLAQNQRQAQQLWHWREAISGAQARAGKNIKHDIALPISAIPQFIASTDSALQAAFPGCRLVCFGHMGDGNLHFNVAPPAGIAAEDFLLQQTSINRIVHDAVAAHDGSISAEHGIGELKREELQRYKSETALQMMRSIKQALDPLHIMNPGKLL